jgi:hypothetical protein
MYFFPLSQEDVAQDGVLALRLRRWSGSASGLDEAVVVEELNELAAGRFVVIDRDTEELLIRSFIRRDGVYRQPNLLRAAKKHLVLVKSPAIRAALAAEMLRIRSLDDVPQGSVADVDAMFAELFVESVEIPADMPTSKGSPKGSPNPSDMPTSMPLGERGVVTAVTTDSPYLLDPLPLAPVPSAPPLASLAVRQRSRADVEFDRFWAAYPRRVAKREARKAWDRAIQRADPDRIRIGAERYRDDPGRDPAFTAHPATWLNGDRWNDEPTPRARASPNGFVERDGLRLRPETAARLDDRARFEAMDAANAQTAIGAGP